MVITADGFAPAQTGAFSLATDHEGGVSEDWIEMWANHELLLLMKKKKWSTACLHEHRTLAKHVLPGTVKGTTNMISFKYSFLSALFGGVIGGVLGVMLTLKIFGEQGQEQADEDEEALLQLELGKEPVEHDYIPEIWILYKMSEFSFLFFFFYFFLFLVTHTRPPYITLVENFLQ